MKVILKNKYTNYHEGLKSLNIESLDERRRKLCLKFAKNCLKIDKVKGMFKKKKNIHNMQKRKSKIFEEKCAKTKRYQISAIPYLSKLLNEECAQKDVFVEVSGLFPFLYPVNYI